MAYSPKNLKGGLKILPFLVIYNIERTYDPPYII